MNCKDIEIHLYTDEIIHFQYDDDSTIEDACMFAGRRLKLKPINLPLFGLVSLDHSKWWPLNKKIHYLITNRERSCVFRCRFKLPARYLKNVHSDFQTFLHYLFAQCQSDLLSGRLESIYKTKISLEDWNGVAILNLVCQAKSQDICTSDLPLKDIQQTFHEETKKKTSTVFSRAASLFNIQTMQHEIYRHLKEYEERDKNTPLSELWCRYVCWIYDLCSEYCCEYYPVHIHIDGELKEKTISYPQYSRKKGNYIGSIDNLFTVLLSKCYERWMVHIHRERGHMIELLFDHFAMAESFVSLLVSYYQLTVHYYHCLCPDLEPPSLTILNKRRCHGPITNRMAEKLLEPSKEESYILHRSTELSEHLIMTVYSKDDARFCHFQILWLADDRITWFCDNVQTATTYGSVAEMLADVPALASVRNIIKPSPLDHSELLLCREEATLSSPKPHRHSSSPTLLSRSDVTRIQIIGKGHYTTVCYGHIHSDERIVAIKYLRPFDDRHLVVEALQESVNLLREVNSPYLTRLLGVCLVPPFMAVLEHCQLGSLLQCCLQHTVQFHHLIAASHHLSQALKDLASVDMVHGSIMCRNVLVDKLDSDIVVKLADPGMIHLYKNLSLDHLTNETRLPWLSPELRTDLSRITEASDVYSFGSTMWEMFSYGAVPPSDPFSEQVVPSSLVVADDDPASLTKCKTLMAKLIRSCWDSDPSARPHPIQLCQRTFELTFLIPSDSSSDVKGSKLTVQLPPVKESAKVLSGANFYSQFPITEPPNIHGFMSKGRSETDDVFDAFDDCMLTPGAGSASLEPVFNHNDESIAHNVPEGDGDAPSPRHPLTTPSLIPQILDRENIVEKVLVGKGFYGEVYKGLLVVGGVIKNCAIKKVLRDDLSGRESKSLEDEGKLMTRLKHDNIVQFYGMCLRSKNGNKPMMLVMEYMKNGALSTLLRSKHTLSEAQRVSIASDIARGMEYLSSMNVIHRDLAARNILLTDSLTAKISDFGLAKLLQEKDYYRVTQENSNVPAMWYPPEFFIDGKSTSEGDVWSYGITLWEMYSPGEKPKLKNAENTSPTILAALQRGDRLECPKMLVSDKFMYTDVMMACWSSTPCDRPSFSHILLMLYRDDPACLSVH